MTLSKKMILSYFTAAFFGLAIWSVAAFPVSANTMTLESAPSRYFELKAKLVYLQAFLDALLDGEMSPAPTFVTSLSGDTISITGTLARDPNPDMMELCGPMVKGTIDWGDGVSESIHGLGCSGDAHMFAMHHRYAESGSYEIHIEDATERSKRHVVAIRVVENDSAPTLEVAQSDSEVAVEGEVVLDAELAASCEATAIATLNWGDGSVQEITTDCSDTEFAATHSYAMAGTYKISVRDIDGDMTQTLVTIE